MDKIPSVFDRHVCIQIGIPATIAATEAIVLPSGVPLAEWEGIPIMPGAISGETIEGGGGYQFTIQATVDEITRYYETELASLGYEISRTVDETAGYAFLSFTSGGTNGAVVIAPLGGITGVAITLSR